MKGLFSGHLIGNACRNVELRQCKVGQVGSTGIAVNEGDKDNPNVFYVEAVFWGKTADIASRFVQKGTPVYCEGRVYPETYQGNDGKEHTKICMSVSKMQLLGASGYGNRNGGYQGTPYGGQQNQRQQQQYTQQQVEDLQNFGSGEQASGDDIPF